MTVDERTQALVEAGQWSTGESLLNAAAEWVKFHKQELGGIRANQWEALQRSGERAASLLEYFVLVRAFLKAAAARDKAQSTWGRKGLVAGLLGEMRRASLPDPGTAGYDLRQVLRKLTPEGQIRAKRTMRLRAARQFIMFVVMTVKVERRGDGGGRNE